MKLVASQGDYRMGPTNKLSQNTLNNRNEYPYTEHPPITICFLRYPPQALLENNLGAAK